MIIDKLSLVLFTVALSLLGATYEPESEFQNNTVDEVVFVDETPLLLSGEVANVLHTIDSSWGVISGITAKPLGEKLSERRTVIVGERNFLIWDYATTNGLLNFFLVNKDDFSLIRPVSYQYKEAGKENVSPTIDNIYGLQGSFGGGKFWVPTYQGGIAVVDPTSGSVEAIVSVGGSLTASAAYPYVSPIERYRPRTVLYKDQILYVTSSDTVVHTYAIATDTWSSVALPQNNGRVMMADFDSRGDLLVYSTLFSVENTDTTDTASVLQRLGTSPLTVHSGYVSDFKFDAVGNLFVQHNDSITFSVYNTNFEKTTVGNALTDAVLKNSQFNFAKVTDYDMFGSQLIISTTQGVVYFEDFNNGQGDYETFRRDREIVSGLKEVYAAPSIITDESGAIIEYGLSEDDVITIDIFDANLDFVCRLIDKEARQASGDKHSTNRARDRWDGSFNNDGGTTVAPGVYYFKIVAEKGGRAFGKVIVAKN